MTRRYLIPALSFVFTYLFFIEYLSPFRKVHIPYDLQGYHYPLVDYAFQALKAGHFPEWDWTIYCGQSFVGNIQAALFYPPTWLLFAANIARSHVSYQSLQVFELAHVWLAFVLCYAWLRSRHLKPLACMFGAGIFAYSGYMLLQLQHEGLIGGYTWFPLGFWGIDQAVESKGWRPFWKLVAASALCFLAGYPPTWVVFAVSMLTYAVFSKSAVKATLGTVVSLAASFALSAVQLLPTLEATSLKLPELRYGLGIRSWAFYLSYLVPNFYNFGLNADIHANPGKEYLYLGAPALFGVLCLLRVRKFREVIPALAAGLACLVFLTNPYGLVLTVIKHSTLLGQIVRDWYFLAGLTAAVAVLAAHGLDDFLRRTVRPLPDSLAWLSVALLSGWSIWSLYRWLPRGPGFDHGVRSILDPAIFLFFFASGLYILRGAGRAQGVLTIVLLLAVGIDYKVFGTSKRFNAAPGSGDTNYSTILFPQIDSDVYAQIRAHRDYRILNDIYGPFDLDFRLYPGLRTPQGSDPLFSSQYRQLLNGDAEYRGNWDFDIQPGKEDLLQALGVRYFISAEASPLYAQYRASPGFHQIGTNKVYYRVFEYRNARPSFGWESGIVGNVVTARWTPEIREFVVHSTAGGRFTLHEQFWPGWQVSIDGRSVRLERWGKAFQAVWVPPGDHRVQFRFRSRGLRWGALVSLASVFALLLLLFRHYVFLPSVGRNTTDNATDNEHHGSAR
jgi:hypothetical protein